MDLLLHRADDRDRHRPDPKGRLSTVGHRAAFRAFARAAKRARIRFMVIGGTYRDVAIRAASTRDIDVVLVDRPSLDAALMREAGFEPVRGAPHAWRFVAGKSKVVDVEIAAIASTGGTGPFSVAFQHAQSRTIEGVKVIVPALDDYVILKLLAADDNARRRPRDLVDVQHALAAHPDDPRLALTAIRTRLRDAYGQRDERLQRLIASFRSVRRVERPRGRATSSRSKRVGRSA